jgi:hypothetical protein
MLERTFRFWRRWVGKDNPAPPAPAPSGAGNGSADRRLWVRYPADLITNVHLADQPNPAKRPAMVRDISRGGANLLLDQEVQPGQLVNLELPSAAEGAYQVLACVVRSEVEPSGRWALGCVFSRELSEEDLNRFGARRVRHAPEDKRTWMRFTTKLKATFQHIGPTDSPRCDAEVLNISASGVGLAVAQPVEAGALLNLDLVAKDGAASRTILACVVHVSQPGDQRWALGCNFIRELSEEDLKALV